MSNNQCHEPWPSSPASTSDFSIIDMDLEDMVSIPELSNKAPLPKPDFCLRLSILF